MSDSMNRMEELTEVTEKEVLKTYLLLREKELRDKTEKQIQKTAEKTTGRKLKAAALRAERDRVMQEKYGAFLPSLGKDISLENLPIRERNRFLKLCPMIKADLRNRTFVDDMSRYLRKNGVIPFEREKQIREKLEEFEKLNWKERMEEMIRPLPDRYEADVRLFLETTEFMRPLWNSNYYRKEGEMFYPPYFPAEKLREYLYEIPMEFFDMEVILPLAEGDFRFRIDRYLKQEAEQTVPFLKEVMKSDREFSRKMEERFQNASQSVMDTLKDRFPKERIRQCIQNNPVYVKQLEKREKLRKKKEEIQNAILQEIPSAYRDAFPCARAMHRHFILHVGPANSGKTHDAIEALKQAEHGIYLAPLRLLAYEQYENLSKSGIACSMITGEEKILTPGAQLQSSTIEMLKMSEVFDTAVIDEAQMIADPFRGGAWSKALYGICSNTVHVCLAGQAEELIVRIIKDCGDTFELIRHERKTSLVLEEGKFCFPRDVKPGDGIIVFSRRNVHAAAAALKKEGMKVSILYGDLPYEVRHHEAEKFLKKDTQVLVSTDVIGMGMNLPLRRIVFLELSKYDGTGKRILLPEEIRQIAGRAGRYGIYPEGYVNGIDRKILHKGLEGNSVSLQNAVISFPEPLISVPGKLSDTMRHWAEMEAEQGTKKSDLSVRIQLAIRCEKKTKNHETVYFFSGLPVDPERGDLIDLFDRLLDCVIHGVPFDLSEILGQKPKETDSLSGLEEQCRRIDLFLLYCAEYQPQDCDALLREKQAYAGAIMAKLDRSEFIARKCRYCGTVLPWNYPYGMCGACHDRMYPRYDRNGFDDWDEW